MAANQEKLQTFLAVVTIMAGGIFVRMYGLGVWDYYIDEIWHVHVASQPTIADVFYTNLTEDGHPILSYILQHYALLLWDDPWAARAPSLIAGTLAIPAGYFLGKELFSTRGGALFTAFFIAFSSLMVQQSDVARGYTLCFFFSTIALWAVLRYARTHRLSDMFIYFIALGLALLSEWSAVIIAPFTALYLLYSLWRRRTLADIFCYIAIHANFLAYLLWFKQALHTIGQLNWSPHYLTQSSLLGAFFWKTSHLLEFMLESGFSYNFTRDPHLQNLFLIMCLICPLILLAGIIVMVRKHAWMPLMLIVITTTSVVSLDIAGLIPFSYPRRSIDYAFAALPVYYYVLCYMYRYGRRILPMNPAFIAIGASMILCTAYALPGRGWRQYHEFEFQQTREQTKEMMDFLDKQVQPDDLIITDWLSSLYLWKYNKKSCLSIPLAPGLALYPCDKAPVYVIVMDSRTDMNGLSLIRMQETFRRLQGLGALQHIQRWWIFGVQHYDLRADFVSPRFTNELSTMADDNYSLNKTSTVQMMHDDKAFMRFAYENAHPQHIAFTDGCQEVNFKEKSQNCIIRLAIMALPAETIHTWFINHPDYLDITAQAEGK